MNIARPLKGGVLVAVITAVGTPLFVSAENSPVVVESRSSSVTYQPPVEVPDQFPDSAPLEGGVEGQYQLQLLQQEVMELRGKVEQLQYELDRQKSIQDDRYLELDARLQQLMQNPGPAASSEPVSQSEVPVDSARGSSEIPSTDTLDEETLYDTTQLLIRNRQYDLAITQLESLIARFPDGQFTPNAYYWLGQVYAAKVNPDFEKARQALAQVISYFPDHPKVPDAAYALGKVYHTLGDCDRARDLLQQVVDQYPGKSAAKLAESYLRESVSCET